LAGAS